MPNLSLAIHTHMKLSHYGKGYFLYCVVPEKIHTLEILRGRGGIKS